MDERTSRGYGTFRVVLRGGAPWGVALDGGSDNRCGRSAVGAPLHIAQVEPGSKAYVDGRLQAGDRVLRVNDISCEELAEARQMISSAFYTLTLTLWRWNTATPQAVDSELAESSSERLVLVDGNRDCGQEDSDDGESGDGRRESTSTCDEYNLDDSPAEMEKHSRKASWERANSESYPRSFAHKTLGLARPAAAFPLTGLWQQVLGSDSLLPSDLATADGGDPLESRSGGGGPNMNAAAKPATVLSGAVRRNVQQPASQRSDGSLSADGSRLAAACQQRSPRAEQATSVVVVVGRASDGGRAVSGPAATAAPSLGKENRGPLAAGIVATAAVQSADCSSSDQGRWRLAPGETVKQQAVPAAQKVSASHVGDAHDPRETHRRHGLGGSAADVDSAHVVDAFGFMTGSLLPPTISPWKVQPSESGGLSAGTDVVAPSRGSSAVNNTTAANTDGRPLSGASRWIQVSSRVLEAREAKVAKVEQHSSGSGVSSGSSSGGNCGTEGSSPAVTGPSVNSNGVGARGCGAIETDAVAPVSVRSIVSAFERPGVGHAAAQKLPVAVARPSPESSVAAVNGASGSIAVESDATVPSTVRHAIRTNSDILPVTNEALPPRPLVARPAIGCQATAAPVTAATMDFLAADDDDRNCRRELDNRLGRHLSWYEQVGTAATDADYSGAAAGTSRLGGAVSCSRRSFASRDDTVATFASSSAAASTGRPATSLNRTLSFAGSTNFASSATRGFARQRPTEIGRIIADSEERKSHSDAHADARRWAPASSALVTTRELPMKRAAADFYSNQHKAKIQPNAAFDDCAAQFYSLDNDPAESQAGSAYQKNVTSSTDPVASSAYPSRGGGRWAQLPDPGFSVAHVDHVPFSLPASSGDGGCGGDDVDDRSSTATSSSCCSSAGCHDDRSYDGGRRSASPVAYLLDPGDGQRWHQRLKQHQHQRPVAEQLLPPSTSSTMQNGSWQSQAQLPLNPSSREKATDGWSNGRGSAIGGGAFNGSNGFNGNSIVGGGGAIGEGSTRRLKRAVSTNILPSRSPAAAASAAGAALYGGNGGSATATSRQQQQPLQNMSPSSGGTSSVGCVTPREAQLNEYNERRSRPEAPTSSPVSEEAPTLPPRAAASQSGFNQQAAIIAAHQHFHSMSSLAPAEQRTAPSNDDHLRSSSYRPPQPTSDFHSSRGYGARTDPAAVRSQSPVGSQQHMVTAPSRQRLGNAGIRRVESYRVVPTSAASAAAADSSPGSRFDERDRSKQEIRQSLLDFYKQKTGTSADGGSGSPVAQDVRGDSDSPPFSAPAHLLAKQSPSRSSSRDFGLPWSRLSVASNGTLSVENDAKSSGAGIAAQLRRSGSFSSVTTDRGTGSVGVDSQRAAFLQQSTATGSGRNADSWGWSSPVSSPFVDGKPAVSSSSSSQSESSVSGRVKKLPVAEVSPFSRTTTFTAEAEIVTETSSCEPYSSSDSGPLPSSATATSPRKVGNVYLSSPSDSYNHYNGPPSPGSPPVLPPRNYRLNSGETEAKTNKTASYETALTASSGSPTSSEKIFDGQPTTTSYPGVRMRNKPAPVPLPTDAVDRFSSAVGDDLDRDYREQLRRASATQYKRASLSATSTSSQLSSPGASSPANRKSLHIDGDAEPAVTYRQHSSNAGSRPSSGVFRADEPRQRWSCEASQLMPPPLPVARHPDHARQGSVSCTSPGFSSRSPVADEVFSARSSPLAADDSTATVAISLLSVPRSGRERPESTRAESVLPTPSPNVQSHRRSSSVTVETASPYGLSHAASISSVHAHSTSMLRADLEVATVLQPSPEDGIPERRLSGAVAAAANGCADASRFSSGFKTISMEIMENLKGLGISVSEKRFTEDVVDGGSKQESISALPPDTAASADDGDGGSSAGGNALTVVHVRQKSQEEILCDSKMQILAQSIEADDAAVSRVLAPPEGFRQASDYLSGVFDDLLRREQQRKARLSSCGAADKTGSSASPASLEFDSSSRESPACDSGIYCQQSPSAIVSHSRRLPSVGGDGDSGSIHTRLHEWLQNQDYCCSSPNSADSQKKKDELVSILRRKLELLRAEKETREAALKQNESAGDAVAAAVADKCSERDASKYRSYVDDLDKITKLLLKLSRRLARAENDLRAAEALIAVDGRRPPDEQQKAAAEQRRDSLRRQHDDALLLKDGIDRQRKSVSSSLQSCLSAEQYEQYEAFVVAKVALTMEHADVEDRIAFSEEQLGVLEKLAVTTAFPSPLSSLPLADA